ncbi:MAG TPA: hypothetical protein VMW63_03755 [Methanoregulaceae archaeon]|nr:hypothetical protein [Methanoregulaceae archaeon]
MSDKGDEKSVIVPQTGSPPLTKILPQYRKTHQQGMYMLNGMFYERPTEG